MHEQRRAPGRSPPAARPSSRCRSRSATSEFQKRGSPPILRVVVERRRSRQPRHDRSMRCRLVQHEVDERRRRRREQAASKRRREQRSAKRRSLTARGLAGSVAAAARMPADVCRVPARGEQTLLTPSRASSALDARLRLVQRRLGASSGRPAPTGSRSPSSRRSPATAARADASRRRCRARAIPVRASTKLSPAPVIAVAKSGRAPRPTARLTPERLAGPANFHDVRACVSADAAHG